MATQSVNFTLKSADAKLVDRLKKRLEPTHGELSSVAVIRIALRALEKTYAPGDTK